MRIRSGLGLFAALCLVLGGCGGAGATRVPPASPTVAATALPPTPTAAAGGPPPTPHGSFEPAQPFTFVGAAPAVTTALAGLPDEQFINPGAIVAAPDGRLHMFANLFTGWPGPVEVVHLTSADGVRWTRVARVPELSSPSLAFADPGSDVSTGFVTTSGQWVLILESVRSVGPWQLYEATAPGPDGPWTVDQDPILPAGDPGSIDDGGLHWPSVVQTGSGYAMYYRALRNASGPGVITAATSSDGRTWTRTGRPILSPDRPAEGHALDRPRVVATDGGYLMLYAGSALTNRFEASSVDGLTWTKTGDGPVIDRSRFPVTAPGAWDCAIVRIGGRILYLLEIGSSSGGTADYVAASP